MTIGRWSCSCFFDAVEGDADSGYGAGDGTGVAVESFIEPMEIVVDVVDLPRIEEYFFTEGVRFFEASDDGKVHSSVLATEVCTYAITQRANRVTLK